MIYGIPLRLFSKQFHCIFNYCVAQKISTPPHRRDWKFPGGWGVSKTKNFKEMHEFNWNLQRGGGSFQKLLLWWRYGYFMELHIGKVKKLLSEKGFISPIDNCFVSP